LDYFGAPRGQTTTMFNPSFQTMVVEVSGTRGQPPSSVLIIESIGNNETDATPSAAYFTDSAHAAPTPPPMAVYTLSDSNIDNRSIFL
jgi:hypothetical protein